VRFAKDKGVIGSVKLLLRGSTRDVFYCRNGRQGTRVELRFPRDHFMTNVAKARPIQQELFHHEDQEFGGLVPNLWLQSTWFCSFRCSPHENRCHKDLTQERVASMLQSKYGEVTIDEQCKNSRRFGSN
jgi:hypothetical protein